MSIRLVIVSLLVCGLWLLNGVASAENHPLSNKATMGGKSFAWDLEYDEDHPRNGDHAVRLIVPAIENPATKPPDGIIILTGLEGCKLYRFKAPAGGNYVLKGATEGGDVDLTFGVVQWAPHRPSMGGGPKTHWSKAALKVRFAGTYTNAAGQTVTVDVVGVLHPGHENKKVKRNSYRLVLQITEKTAREADPTLRILEMLSEKDLKIDELLRKLLRKFFLDETPCDELPPPSAEEPHDEGMSTTFPYTPTLPMP